MQQTNTDSIKEKLKTLYKEYFEVSSEEEADEKRHELNKKDYKPQEIYQFNYKGKDGNFHRGNFVFANK